MHESVLLKEVIEGLNLQSGQTIVDGTVNGGGHTLEIAKYIGESGKIIAIDWDADLVSNLQKKVSENVVVVHGNYADMEKIVSEQGINEVDGVLLDVGFSSYHIESSHRGFSFQEEEPLDMRYDTTGGITAAEVVNTYPQAKLAEIIKTYGEERYARPITKAITESRKKERIITTKQLIEVIRSVASGGYSRSKIHFATRTFQALRIEVNHELENIEKGLKSAESILRSGGRIAVITFHSLEDRIVKNYFRERSLVGALKKVTKKPIVASPEEVRANSRARSAKLRIAQKV